MFFSFVSIRVYSWLVLFSLLVSSWPFVAKRSAAVPINIPTSYTQTSTSPATPPPRQWTGTGPPPPGCSAPSAPRPHARQPSAPSPYRPRSAPCRCRAAGTPVRRQSHTAAHPPVVHQNAAGGRRSTGQPERHLRKPGKGRYRGWRGNARPAQGPSRDRAGG